MDDLSCEMNEKKTFINELTISDDEFDFNSSITEALAQASEELETVQETIDSVNAIKPNCDKTDYALAASIGVLCGVIDIFLVGKPGDSPIGDLSDQWFQNRTIDFAKLCGWKDDGTHSLDSAIRHLERQFNVPYDQRGAGDAGSIIFDLTPDNHHFKSLAHNPTLLGLFFSILDQFANTSHFVSNGELISLNDADGKFELYGNDFPSKLFCAFVNWFGHIISDISGSAGSKGRGMGIPSPLWAWTNDIIAIKRKLSLPVTSFDKSINELALNIYEKGFDIRFQSAQLIPVFINEILVRLFYSVRRLIRYFANTESTQFSFHTMWDACEPFSNATVKRMLTVAHGSFCVVDIGDATINGFAKGAGTFNVAEFVMRLNIVGIGRFAISLYGEANRAIVLYRIEKDAEFAEKEEIIVQAYIDGLKELSQIYDDHELMTFVDDFKNSDMYETAFKKTVALAELRCAPDDKIVHSKDEIDLHFRGDNRDEQ